MFAIAVALAAYALWFDSIPASVLAGALVLYRAQRPSQLRNRMREFQYARQAAEMAADVDG